MTPPARPDPVAALLNERGYINMSGDRFREHLAESGYVLVSADRLAEALASLPHWTYNVQGHVAPACDLFAAAILRALNGPAR